MPTFNVEYRRTLVECCVVEIEASSWEEAESKAIDLLENDDDDRIDFDLFDPIDDDIQVYDILEDTEETP